MRKPSKGCKERDANYHRNDHTDDHGKRFFKILIGDFHKRLVIPGTFVKRFGDKIEGNITLESLGGYTFDVQVTKNLGRIVLQSGWNSFVTAHDLKTMDFLVFKYDGMSRMKVLIFDPSGCEKVPPCFVVKNAISGGRKRKEAIDISSGYANLPMRTPETKKKAWKRRNRSRIRICSSRSLSNSSGGMLSSEDNEAHSVPSSYMFARGTSLDSIQNKKLKERLGAICSKIPIYVCVIKKSNISGKTQSMDFTGEFSDVCLPFKRRALILQCHRKSWEVTCHIQFRNAKYKFHRVYKGWARFARDNNLQLGDMCLFQPMKTKKYKMNVHIIRYD